MLTKKTIVAGVLCIFAFSAWAKDSEGLFGVWENDTRFVAFTQDDAQSLHFEIILKPYYSLVYESPAKIPYRSTKDAQNIFYLSPFYGKPGFLNTQPELPVALFGDNLFTSFFTRLPYRTNTDTARHGDLFGLWLSQGEDASLKLYAVPEQEHRTAYFFMKTRYIAFRYWTDDIEYVSREAAFIGEDDVQFNVPQYLRIGDRIFTCTTGRKTLLRNYETGTYVITNTDGRKTISLVPDGAGFGSAAAADIYPHPRYPIVKDLPLYVAESAFAFGKPFLTKTSITNLAQIIKEHNAKRRPLREPFLRPDEWQP